MGGPARRRVRFTARTNIARASSMRCARENTRFCCCHKRYYGFLEKKTPHEIAHNARGSMYHQAIPHSAGVPTFWTNPRMAFPAPPIASPLLPPSFALTRKPWRRPPERRPHTAERPPRTRAPPPPSPPQASETPPQPLAGRFDRTRRMDGRHRSEESTQTRNLVGDIGARNLQTLGR